MKQIENNMRRMQVGQCIAALGLFLSVLLLQIFSVLIVSIVYSITHNKFVLENYVMIVSALSALFSLAWCGYWYKKSTWRVEHFSYRKAFRGKTVLSIIGLAVGGCTSLSIALSILQMLVPQWFVTYQGVMDHFTVSAQGLVYFYVLLLGPISEEMIFRGAILDHFYLAFPFWAANLLQAALFGVYHGNLIQGLYAFALGLALGLIRKSTETILASMITHILFNATSYALQWIFPSGKQYTFYLFIVILCIAVPCFVYSLWYTIHTTNAVFDGKENGNMKL